MLKKKLGFLLTILMLVLVLSACGGGDGNTVNEPVEEEVAESPGLQMEAAAVAQQFWSDEEYQESITWTDADIINPEAPVYLQSLLDNKVDTSEYAMEPPYDICFSNAGVNNTWRVTGYVTMREQVEQLRADGLVRNFIHVDAEGSDEKQIADIEDLFCLLYTSPSPRD